MKEYIFNQQTLSMLVKLIWNNALAAAANNIEQHHTNEQITEILEKKCQEEVDKVFKACHKAHEMAQDHKKFVDGIDELLKKHGIDMSKPVDPGTSYNDGATGC